MRFWGTPPVDPVIAKLVKLNQTLVAQNVALVERVGKLVSLLARAEPSAERAPQRNVGSTAGGARPNFSPEFWRSDSAAEIQNDGTVVDMTQEEVEAAEMAIRESFRSSLREQR